jgi:hypothetical protein
LATHDRRFLPEAVLADFSFRRHDCFRANDGSDRMPGTSDIFSIVDFYINDLFARDDEVQTPELAAARRAGLAIASVR